MRRYLFVLIFFLASISTDALIFSEIMYNPLGNDSKHEWIEVYNEENAVFDLNDLILYENNNNHELNLIFGNWSLSFREYVVIADNPATFMSDYPNFNSTLLDSTFSLKNDGENLTLITSSGNISLFYNTFIGADGDNHTLSFINGTWRVGIATPGEENKLFLENDVDNLLNIILSSDLDEEIYLGQEYDSLFKLKINGKICSSKQDFIRVNYNLSGNDYFYQDSFTKEIGCSSSANTGKLNLEEEGRYTLCGSIINSTLNESNYEDNSLCFNFTAVDPRKINCDISLEIYNNDTLFYQQDQEVKFRFYLNDDTFPFQIEYWIEDLFKNAVKSRYTTTNLNQKSWRANIEEEDRVLYLKAQLYPICNDTNLSNNFAQKLILITNSQPEIDSISGNLSESDSWIKILKITPESPNFGELIKVEAEIYKGNTNRYALSAGIKKLDKGIGPITKINLESKNQKYKVTLPLWLEPNCNDKIKEGTAKVFIEGLGITEEKEISISGKDGSWCGISPIASSVNNSDAPANAKLSYSFQDLPTIIAPNKPLKVKISLKGDEKSHKIKIWSYLYRGPKCYSCKESREENVQELFLGAGEDKTINFELVLPKEMEEGEYFIKTEINKDGLKTNNQMTESISIASNLEGKQTATEAMTTLSSSGIERFGLNPENSNSLQFSNSSKGIIVYQSPSEKSKDLILYFLLISLGGLCLFFLKKK